MTRKKIATVRNRTTSWDSIHNRVLKALCDEPFLSRRQLELELGCSDGWSRRGLARLIKRGWIRRFDAHQPSLHTRSLFAPTTAGVEEAARQNGMDAVDFCREKHLDSARLERLALMMERVFQLRTIFFWLSRPTAAGQGDANSPSQDWRAVAWDVEVARFFSLKDRALWIPFHGAAVFSRAPHGETTDPRWMPAVVEFDLGRVAVQAERERFARFVAAQDDARYWNKESEHHFPVLLIMGRDEFRLQQYYTLLRDAALSRQLPMPRAYLTTFDDVLTLREDNHRPIWYSTVSGRRVPLLFDLEGNRGPLPEHLPWRRMPLQSAGIGEEFGAITPEFLAQRDGNEPNEHRQLAGLAFGLVPLEKKLLDEVAAHPLLESRDLAMLLRATERRVRPALRRLEWYGLVEGHDARYLLAPRGERYLALIAGFGSAVRRYALARGWGRGFETLLKHWEHTRAENEFFLHLAAIASRRGHTLTWRSELEGRLYYEAGRRRHSFMPDGRGTYLTGQRQYEFALEIDRTRASREKIRRKFIEYAACLNSYVLRPEGIELLRLLLITSSWERAETLRRIALEIAGGVPIFISTFDRYRVSGADAPIWLRGDEASSEPAAETPKVHCFECFIPRSARR